MTVSNVKNAVIAYGFNFDLAENDTLFVSALNAAAQEINRLRPVTDICEIVHEPYKPIFTANEVTEVAEDASYTATARSAVFEVDGSGSLYVTAKDGDRSVPVYIDGRQTNSTSWDVDTGWKRIAVRSSSYADITIAFSGEYLFRIRNIEFYAEAVPPTAHIKSGDFVEYDLKELADEFESISYILRDGVGYIGNETYRVLNNRIFRVPASDRGTYEIVYKKRIPRLGENANTYDTEEIPLREDTIDALPVLVASYVWLEDNEDRAKYYRALFERMMATVPEETYVSHIRDTRGWT